jgi:hypothetical protein
MRARRGVMNAAGVVRSIQIKKFPPPRIGRGKGCGWRSPAETSEKDPQNPADRNRAGVVRKPVISNSGGGHSFHAQAKAEVGAQAGELTGF